MNASKSMKIDNIYLFLVEESVPDLFKFETKFGTYIFLIIIH